jgi:type II secretory pathway pseudopilin PulG
MANVELCEGRAFGLAPDMPVGRFRLGFRPPMGLKGSPINRPHFHRFEMNTPKTDSPLCQESGFTLIEMLVGMLLTVAIFMLALPVIDGAFKTEGRVETAALGVGDARVFSERVGRDLRLTDKVYTAGQNSLSVETYVHRTACGSGVPSAETEAAIKCTVVYACSGDSCTRQEGSAAPVTLVTGLSDENVFAYPCPPNPIVNSTCPTTPNPDDVSYVGINAVLPNQSDIGGDAITLQDGTALRNVHP